MSIALRGITKDFKNFHLSDINLNVGDGEFFVILGPSGAGKTLILEILAGLTRPDRGSVSGISTGKIGLIYQDYWLFPHLTVFNNIAYGLKIRGLEKKAIGKTVRGVAARLEIAHLLDRDIENLSGGEKQRVAIGRAMAISPDVYLFDEPTASLDRNLRLKTRRIFMDLHRDSRATFILVTHDFEEALSLADRLAVIMKGRIIQTGKPDQVFHHPRTKEVADFLGYRNVFGGRVRNHFIELEKQSIQVPLAEADFSYAAIRSDEIIVSRRKFRSSARNTFKGRVKNVFKKSTAVELELDIGVLLVVEITRKSYQEMEIKPGDTLWATFKVSAIRVFQH